MLAWRPEVAQSRSGVVSSFTIIKGSMIEDTYAVFRDWDFDQTREENLRRVRDENTIGATSSNWLRDVYKVLHRRFEPNKRDRALVQLAQTYGSLDTWKPLLLWHMTRDEFLLRDFLINWLFKEYEDGVHRVRTDDLHPYLQELHARGLVEEPWKETTLKRVASALLRMTVDFGLMTGTMAREFTSYHLPDESFLYLLHAMYETSGNAYNVVHSPDWRLFLMTPEKVQRELYRLHQFRKLRFEVAGSLMELSLPYESAEAYARELAQ
jgi:hypothetical protein